jgi:hypothetical protein
MEHQKAGSQYMTGSVSRGGEGVVRIPGDPENSPEKSLKALRAVVLFHVSYFKKAVSRD